MHRRVSALLALGLTACGAGGNPRTEFCRDWCEAQSECELAESERELQRHGASSCEQKEGGLTPCIQACHSALLAPETGAAARSCLECLDDASADICRGARDECREACDVAGPDARGLGWTVLSAQECWFGEERPEPLCPMGGVHVGAWLQEPGGYLGRLNVRYTGTASVTGTSPLVLTTAPGDAYELHVRGATPPLLFVGDRVTVQLMQDCPFWCEGKYVLRDAAGALLLAVWSGPSVRPQVPELALGYEPAACRGTWEDGRGRVGFDLTLPGGGRVAPGASARLQGFELRNGDSTARYAVSVTDTPLDWLAGSIERSP